jgi:hypothetical protein
MRGFKAKNESSIAVVVALLERLCLHCKKQMKMLVVNYELGIMNWTMD